MPTIRRQIAIIGAGTAGLKAYKAATAAGADALLIERGGGGSTCTRVGCMPSKLLIAAARTADLARRSDRFGVKIDDVRIDGHAVMARIQRERDRFVASVLAEYHDIPADDRLHGTARFTGPTSLSVGDVQVEADAVIIATGGHPVIPDNLLAIKNNVHTHETIFDIANLPATMAVLGAGPVGIELAQAFARLDVSVTLLDEEDTVGGLHDPEANAAAIAALCRDMTIHSGVSVMAEPTPDGRVRLYWTGDDTNTGSVTVDLLLVATGRPPSLCDLGLEHTGIELDDHGTPIFDKATRRCGTSNIFIAGDAGAWRPVLHEAARSGRIAGETASGGKPGRLLPAFAVTFTDPHLVEVGCGFNDLPHGAKIGSALVSDNGRATADGKHEGLVRLYGDANRALIGATIVAPDGEHLGHLVALAIDRGIDVDSFVDQAWYHPTVEELLQQAARDLIKGYD